MNNYGLKYSTGYVIVIVFAFMAISLMFFEIPDSNREVFVHMIGIVEGAFVGNLVNYYFGSSQTKNPNTDVK